MSEFDPSDWDVSSAWEGADTYERLQGIGYATEQTLIQNSERIPVIGEGVKGLIDLTKAGAYYAAEAAVDSNWVNDLMKKVGLL